MYTVARHANRERMKRESEKNESIYMYASLFDTIAEILDSISYGRNLMFSDSSTFTLLGYVHMYLHTCIHMYRRCIFSELEAKSKTESKSLRLTGGCTVNLCRPIRSAYMCVSVRVTILRKQHSRNRSTYI